MRVFLDMELAKYGFKRTEKPKSEEALEQVPISWYCREVEIGQQYLKILHGGENPCYCSDTKFFMICPLVSEIYQKFNFSTSHSKSFSIRDAPCSRFI
jgi:hypothetical protein